MRVLVGERGDRIMDPRTRGLSGGISNGGARK